jgi:type I restriction enzyme R subunit
MLREIMLRRRKDELELYKLFANDPAFKAAWQKSMERVVNEKNR